MHVFFIFGPAAAGKYTIGKLVSESLALPLFHNHLTVDLVATLFEFGSGSDFMTVHALTTQREHAAVQIHPGTVRDLMCHRRGPQFCGQVEFEVLPPHWSWWTDIVLPKSVICF